MGRVGTCPVCKKENVRLDALSRKDNKTKICSSCGTMEAISDYINNSKTNRTEK